VQLWRPQPDTELIVTMKRLLFALPLLLLFARPITADVPPVQLMVSPRVQLAPGTVKITLRIEPDARNRIFCVVYDSEGQSGQFCSDLQGADEVRTRELPLLKDLPGGDYVAQAIVGREDGTEVRSNIEHWIIRGLETENTL
jgi:hypothetical protein